MKNEFILMIMNMETWMIVVGLVAVGVLVWFLYELAHPYWAKDDEEC